MKSRRLLLLFIPAGVLLWAVFFAAHLLQAHKKARGAELFKIHESIALYLEDHPGSLSSDIEASFIEIYGATRGPEMLSRFPDGLTFTRSGTRGFTLGEARPHRVSFFTKDRLVSSDAKPPHWEASGEPATR
jgi:hypothetical protein